ncbi:hypothetical protein HDU84_001781 [Entophlyctis sp. JEL0112]|nr:hypothetical protein HDU84_001781 [Entophlyctis sp. JEL0112]
MGPPSTNKKTPVSALSAKSDAKGRDTKAPVKQSANLKKQTFEEDVEGSKVSGRALDLAEGYCLSADQIEELMALDLDSSFEYYSIGKKSMQESVTLQIAVEVEIPLDPLPLDQAITLEEHEERLAKMQEAEELARLEKERREAEERAAGGRFLLVGLRGNESDALALRTMQPPIHRTSAIPSRESVRRPGAGAGEAYRGGYDGGHAAGCGGRAGRAGGGSAMPATRRAERNHPKHRASIMAHFFNDQQGQQAADLQFQSFDYGNARSMAGGNAGSGGSYGQSGYGQAYSSDYSSSIQDSQQTISWVAAFGTGDYPDEPPLLEELGINFSHIKEKVFTIKQLLSA